jgi:hypothetical protein
MMKMLRLMNCTEKMASWDVILCAKLGCYDKFLGLHS